MNLGIDGFNHWSFVNRGDQDGQWQFVDTWNRCGTLARRAAPHRDAYYVLGLATRHLPHRAEVLATRWPEGRFPGCAASGLRPCAVPRTPALQFSLSMTRSNRGQRQFMMEELPQRLAVLRSLPNADPAKTLTYQPVAVRDGAAELRLEPFSLTIVTDTPLPVDGPGRF